MDAKNEASAKTESNEPPTIVEEKISKVGGDPTIRKYNRGRLLGKGGFAKCYEISNTETKKIMAAKIIVKSSLTKSRTRQKLISEIKIHKALKHTNVVGFEHVFEDSDYVYILLELCPNQSLHDLIKRRKRLTEVETQCYVAQLVSALKYLHSHRVIHRDLKLGNLFLNDKMELKLGDFGLATKLEFDGEKRRTVCGTPNYIAPEIIEGKGGHSYEVDIWSLGVIIYTLLLGRPPFETPDVKLTYKRIKACNYSFPDHISISDSAKSLISRILNLEPSKRPTLDEILQHPFMSNGGSIPKLLPISTLSVPPSASYLKQFLPSGNTNKNPIETQNFAETAGPFGFIKTGRIIGTAKPGERNLFTKTQSPTGVTPTQTVTGGDTATTSNPTLDRQSTKGEVKAWSLTKTGTFQASSLGSSQALKSASRPFSVQQNDLRSSQKFRTTQSGTNFGGTPSSAAISASGALTGTSRGITPVANGEVWVKRWVDYSSKYGLGYILSNGISGVYFNDNTKIILEPNTGNFEYIEKSPSEKQDVISTHHINDYPKELQKKVTLLHHFRKYLDGNEKESIIFEEDTKNTKVYVKKWIKTKYAMMFRLSNKIVQMNFTDKTEIILSSEHKMVTYLNKKGERSNYPLATALESPNTDMTKRLKYTKEVLTHMLSENQQDRIPTLQY